MKKLSLLAIAAALIPIPSSAAPSGYQITSTYGPSNVREGQIIRPYRPVVTGKQAVVTARLHNLGVNTTQNPNAYLVLEKLRRSPQAGWQAAFNVPYGIVDWHVGKLYNPTSYLLIKTPQGYTTVTGTRLSVFNDGRLSRVGVLRGAVSTTGAGVTIRVNEGKYTEVFLGRAPSAPKDAPPLVLNVVEQNPITVATPPGNVLLKEGELLGQQTKAQVCDVIRVQGPLSLQVYRDFRVVRPGVSCP